MPENAGLGHINCMILCGQSEPFVESKGRHGFLVHEEGIGLLPSSIPLIGTIVASRIKWHLRLIDERRQLLLHVFSELGRLRPGLVHVLEGLLRRNDWHYLLYAE